MVVVTDSRLVDELERALRDEAYDGGFGYMGDGQFVSYVRGLAVKAAEVVQEALTPTNDEREDEHQAQMIAFERAKLDARNSMRHDPHVWHEALEDALDKVLPSVWHAAAGFRHTEVPEPSAEEWADRIVAAREKAIVKGYTSEHDRKHGIRHLLNWAIDYARRGKSEDSSGLIAAAIDLAEIAYAELERLRHVADTMRAVSEALRTRYASDSQAAYFMRQIDEALAALPEPQAEPSSEHDRDRDGICRACGHGVTAAEILDGEQPCRPQAEPSDAQVRALVAECDKADEDMRKWVRVPVKFVRAALRAAAKTGGER